VVTNGKAQTSGSRQDKEEIVFGAGAIFFEQFWVKWFFCTGLPDGLCIFIPKIPIWVNLENVTIWYGHLEYCSYIWELFWPFGTFCANLVHFLPVLLSRTKKNLAILACALVIAENYRKSLEKRGTCRTV
jgi:hypothetical protein